MLVDTCAHAHAHTSLPVYTHTHTGTCPDVCTPTHACSHSCMYTGAHPACRHTCTHTCTSVDVHTPPLHMRTYAHTHICIYTHPLPVYTCTHTRTHVYTCTHPLHTHMAHLRFASLWEFSDCFRFFASPTPGLMEPCPSRALVTFCELMLWAVALSSRWHRQVLRTTTVPAGGAGGASLPVCPEPRVPSLSRALVTFERSLLLSLGLIKRNVVQHI